MRVSPAQAIGCVNQDGLDQALGGKITHTFKSGTFMGLGDDAVHVVDHLDEYVRC